MFSHYHMKVLHLLMNRLDHKLLGSPGGAKMEILSTKYAIF